MKKNILSFVLLLVSVTVYGGTNSKATQDKPWYVYRWTSQQNRTDATDTHKRFYYLWPDGSEAEFEKTRERPTAHWDYEWWNGFGGAGLSRSSYLGESWDPAGNHYTDMDTAFVWPFQLDETGTGWGDAVYYYQGAADATNRSGVGIWPVTDEHCNVSDSYPPPGDFDEPFDWDEYMRCHVQTTETYTRTADTAWHLQTGGKGLPGLSVPQSVFQFTGYAWDVLDKRAMPPLPQDRAIAPQDITVAGKALGSDHLMYQVLGDNMDIDITPMVKGDDFYTFNVGASKHVFKHQVLCPAVGDPNLERGTIGIGEQVAVYFDPPLTMTFPETPFWYVLGDGSISPDNGSSTLLTANLSPGSATVKVNVRDVTLSAGFSIIPPDSIIVTGQTEMPSEFGTEDSSGTLMGAQTDYAIVVGPTTVSFSNVVFGEEHLPAYDLIWPDRSTNHISFDDEITSRVDCGNAFPAPGDAISSPSPAQSAAHLWNGSSYEDYLHTATWHDRYKNDTGDWVNFCQMTKTYKYFGSNFKCQVTYQGVPGKLQGPY